jgi:hypothetical protein
VRHDFKSARWLKKWPVQGEEPPHYIGGKAKEQTGAVFSHVIITPYRLTVVRKLNRELPRSPFDHSDCILQIITTLAGYAQSLTLNLGLDGFWTFVAQKLCDFLGVLGRDTLFHRAANLVDLAAEFGVRCIEVLERDGSLDQFVFKNIKGGFCSFLGIGFNQKLLIRLLDLGAGVLEVESGINFPVGLIEGVIYLHVVNLGDYIETGICSHGGNLSDSQLKGLGGGDEAGWVTHEGKWGGIRQKTSGYRSDLEGLRRVAVDAAAAALFVADMNFARHATDHFQSTTRPSPIIASALQRAIS